MARKPTQKAKEVTVTVSKTNTLLVSIVSATVANSFIYATVAVATAEGLLDAANPLVECNLTMTNPANAEEVAFRATPAGIALVGEPETLAAPVAETPAAVAHVEPAAALATTPVAAETHRSEAKVVSADAITVDDDYSPDMSGKRARASGSKYNFEILEDGKNSIHVAATAEYPTPVKTLASTVATANLRYATPKVDAEGKPVLREGIKRHKDEATGKVTTTREMVPEMVFARKFAVIAVGATDPRGAGARIVRTV